MRGNIVVKEIEFTFFRSVFVYEIVGGKREKMEAELWVAEDKYLIRYPRVVGGQIVLDVMSLVMDLSPTGTGILFSFMGTQESRISWVTVLTSIYKIAQFMTMITRNGNKVAVAATLVGILKAMGETEVSNFAGKMIIFETEEGAITYFENL